MQLFDNIEQLCNVWISLSHADKVSALMTSFRQFNGITILMYKEFKKLPLWS